MGNELLYDTVTDDTQYPVLAYTRKDLVYLWSIRILAIYISLSWVERNEERGWTEETISEFIKKSKATHPIYLVYAIGINESKKEKENLDSKAVTLSVLDFNDDWKR